MHGEMQVAAVSDLHSLRKNSGASNSSKFLSFSVETILASGKHRSSSREPAFRQISHPIFDDKTRSERITAYSYEHHPTSLKTNLANNFTTDLSSTTPNLFPNSEESQVHTYPSEEICISPSLSSDSGSKLTQNQSYSPERSTVTPDTTSEPEGLSNKDHEYHSEEDVEEIDVEEFDDTEHDVDEENDEFIDEDEISIESPCSGAFKEGRRLFETKLDQVSDKVKVEHPNPPPAKLRKTSSHSVECSSGILTKNGITLELVGKELWRKFHKLGTEMIITKAGRRMFPTLKIRLAGLKPNKQYLVYIDVIPTDDKRYRYVYHSSRWMVAGSGDPPLEPNMCIHSDSPSSGHVWMSQGVISFDKVKLTNNRTAIVSQGHICLHSMHKYVNRIHVQELEPEELKVKTSHDSQSSMRRLERLADISKATTFVFPESTFTTVTAYQNQQITKLKIASNPFAKGFREATRSRDTPIYYPMDFNGYYSNIAKTVDSFLANGNRLQFGTQEHIFNTLQNIIPPSPGCYPFGSVAPTHPLMLPDTSPLFTPSHVFNNSPPSAPAVPQWSATQAAITAALAASLGSSGHSIRPPILTATKQFNSEEEGGEPVCGR